MIIVENFWPIYRMTHGSILRLDFRVRVSHMRRGYKRKINLETKEGEPWKNGILLGIKGMLRGILLESRVLVKLGSLEEVEQQQQ